MSTILHTIYGYKTVDVYKYIKKKTLIYIIILLPPWKRFIWVPRVESYIQPFPFLLRISINKIHANQTIIVLKQLLNSDKI